MNMDFPMTAGVTIDLQSSLPADSASGSQATGSDRFSNYLKDESSRRDFTSNSNDRSCKAGPCKDKSDVTQTSRQARNDNVSGKDVPSDGKELPKDAAAKDLDALEKELSELDAQLDAELAQDTPATAPVQAALNAQANPVTATLQSLQKQLPGDAEEANPTLPNTASLTSAGLAPGTGTPATGSPAALAVPPQSSTPASAAPMTEIPEEVTVTAAAAAEDDVSMEEVLAKMVENKAATEVKVSNGSQPVNIVTALHELGRSAFSSNTASQVGQASHVPQPPTTLSSSALSQSMGNSVQWMLKENIQEANIRVKPSELGPINIKLSMNNDQLSMSLHAAHAATRDALEASLPRVRETFAASNLNLANVDVADQNLPQQQQGMAFADYSEGDSDEYIRPFVPDDEGVIEDSVQLTTSLPVRETAGVLDLFA